jgi:branched-chain amino acid transport system substrate-binding protein
LRPAFLRKQDHSGMIDCYINRIENDEFHVKKKVTKEEMATLLTPRVDFSTQSL